MAEPPPFSSHRLGEVLSGCHEEIISEWRLHARVLLETHHLDKPTITDHLPVIIGEIIADLSVGSVEIPPPPDPEGTPPAHGVQRFYDGLDVGEVVAEYNLLRVAFITVAERHGLYVVGEAMRIINRRIDAAVRESVMAFTARHTLIQKQMEDEHLAFVAHDLRTPLNAASLVVEEMKYGLDAPALAEAAGLFETLQRNLQSVEALIKRVLERRIQATPAGTAFRPERRTFDLWPLVQRLIADLRPVASKQGIKVINEVPYRFIVFADAGLLSQVFQNLLGNAFKYAPGGQVRVSARENANSIECAVEDNGGGIPADLLAKVFDKGMTDPEKDGTGFGLAIVKQIVESHGGAVTAESSAGEGAIFRFSLPRGEEIA